MSPMRYAYTGYFSGIALTYPPANILCWFACFRHSEFSSCFSESSTSHHKQKIHKQHDLKGQDPPFKNIFPTQFYCAWGWIWNYFVCLNIIFPKLFKAKKCSRDGWITVLLVFSINKLSWFERKDQWRETSANTR